MAEPGTITDEGVARLRERIGVPEPHPQPPHYLRPGTDAFRHDFPFQTMLSGVVLPVLGLTLFPTASTVPDGPVARPYTPLWAPCSGDETDFHTEPFHRSRRLADGLAPSPT